MAYDRYDTRGGSRERWRSDDRFERERNYDRNQDRGYRGRDERGFFERAGDEIASWFGDDEAERRRREDMRTMGRDDDYGRRDFGRDESFRRERGNFRDRDRDRWDEGDRGMFSNRGYRGYGGESTTAPWSGDRFDEPGMERGYRPMTGDFGRSDYQRPERGLFRGGRVDEPRERDVYRRTSFAGSMEHHDPHYRDWRSRQIDELDRDYDEYRRENQSKFESDFGSWRERRMQKRGLLGQVREHMEVVGNDGEHVGTVDCTRGDRLILTKSDAESGGVHHSLSCSDVDRIEGDKVFLDRPAEEAKQRWRDESRERALFEREDQGEAGPGMLERSFSGTYR